MRRRRLPVQQELPLCSRRGGARPGAGRPKHSSETVPHARRPRLDGRSPLHVTMRVAPGIWNLRSQRGFATVARALREEARCRHVRITQYSVQGNHLHLIIECSDHRTLSRRMRAFAIRFAKAVNRMMARPRGRVIAERYHARKLATPTEVRKALKYVLCNRAHHAAQVGKLASVSGTLDPYSSANTFDGWAEPCRASPSHSAHSQELILPPETWLLTDGWRRLGPLSFA